MDARRELFHKRVVLGVNKVYKTHQQGLVNKMCLVNIEINSFFKGFKRCFTGQLRPKPCKGKELVLFYLHRDKFWRGNAFLKPNMG